MSNNIEEIKKVIESSLITVNEQIKILKTHGVEAAITSFKDGHIEIHYRDMDSPEKYQFPSAYETLTGSFKPH